MKLILLLLAFFTLSVRANSLPDYCPQTMSIAYFADWYPYVYSKDSGYTGTDFDFLYAITTALGCRIKIAKVPKKRGHKNLEQGKSHIMLAATVTRARTRYAHFSQSYRKEKMSVFYLKKLINGKKPATLQEIIGKSQFIAINAAAWYGKTIEAYRLGRYANKFLHVPSIDKRVAMLRKTRAQAMVDDHMAGCSYFHRQASDVIDEIAIMTVHVSDITFMFSKRLVTPEFVDLLNKEMDRQLELGIYDDIVTHHQADRC